MRHTIAAIRSAGIAVWVPTGAVLGILAGVVLGERTTVFAPIGTAYTMLLEIAIYPYLVCTLLLGLGRLAPGRAGRLLRASWPVYVFVWALVQATLWLLRQAIPPTPPPLVIQPEPAAHTDLLALLIPANPFAALLQNDVPAIVVFAVLYGIAMQGVGQRQTLFDVLEAMRVASLAIWRWVVLLSPFGVFALLAVTAGTLRGSQIGGFLLYNTLFLAGTLVLAIVVLPLIVTALAPTSYRALMDELRPGLILSLVTTLPVVSLPYIQRAAVMVAKSAGCPEGEENDDVIKASVALSYALAQVGNHFCDLLLYFAAYRAGHAIPLGQQMLLPLLTVLSCVGTPSTTIGAVKFFSSWLHLPAGTTELWIATTAITRYGQVLLSVSAFAFISSAVPLFYWRKWRARPAQVATALAGGGALLLVVLAAIAARPELFPPGAAEPLLASTLDPALTEGLAVEVATSGSSGARSAPPGAPTVPAIQAAGALRVGYNPNVIPFSYRNARDALVGYDISFAYRLARDLSVKLVLVPFTWDRLADDLAAGRFDVAMSGIYLTDTRLADLTPGPVYWSSPLALLVPSATADAFTSRAALQARQGLRLAVFDSAVMRSLANRLLPDASVTVVPDYSTLPERVGQVDAALWTLAQARAWAAIHPGWTAVVPTDVGPALSIASMLPPNALTFSAYLHDWSEQQRENGFAAAQAAYWMDGKSREPSRPRWNLLDALTGRD